MPLSSSLNTSLMSPLGEEMELAADAENEERDRRETREERERRDVMEISDRAPEKNLVGIGDWIDG